MQPSVTEMRTSEMCANHTFAVVVGGGERAGHAHDVSRLRSRGRRSEPRHRPRNAGKRQLLWAHKRSMSAQGRSTIVLCKIHAAIKQTLCAQTVQTETTDACPHLHGRSDPAGNERRERRPRRVVEGGGRRQVDAELGVDAVAQLHSACKRWE